MVLAIKILEVIRESGANRVDALCAVKASEAMLPILDLEPKDAVFSRRQQPPEEKSEQPSRR
jgi:hypothetical protein